MGENKMQIEYRKGDMLKNMNQKDIFLHSCNCKNTWGNGIARQIRVKFPRAYEKHKQMLAKQKE